MEYHFKPLAKTCAATGEPLQPGDVCYSALVERDSQMIRLDYSEQAWPGPPEDAVGHWRSIVPEATQDKPKALDASSLLGYFEQLTEEASPAREKFRYVLALLLLQKRKLKIEGTRRDEDAEYLILAGTQGEGPFEVQDHQLSHEEIEQLQNDLNVHLTAD